MSDAVPVCVVRLPEGFTQLLSLTQLYLNDAFLEFLPASFGRSVCCPIWTRMKFFLTWKKKNKRKYKWHIRTADCDVKCKCFWVVIILFCFFKNASNDNFILSFLGFSELQSKV